MAVELTKVALWIETVDPGLPLGFFDAQIRCGDALLGVFDLKVLEDGIPDAAYKPLTGDDKDTAKYYQQANKRREDGPGRVRFRHRPGRACPTMKPLALDFSGFRDLPEDTVEEIGAKAARFEELRKGQAFVRATAAANLYVAAFLLPKTGGAPAAASARTVPTTEELWMALNQGKIRQADGGRAQGRPQRPRLPLAAGVPRYHAARRVRCGARQPAVGADQAAGAGVLRRPRRPRSPRRRTRPRATG